MPAKQSQLVLSAIGKDQTGIVDRLTGAIYDLELNISDSRMTVLGGEFAVQMLIEGPWNQIAKLENILSELESRLGLTIHGKRTDIRTTDTRIRPYAVEVVALDHPGIVHHLASFFSQHHINIEELHTTSYAAAHTGTPMFAVNLQLGVPAEIQISALRDEFMDFCDNLNLDAVLEPLKN
ncbi:MAG: ACT domain-containing protein [Pseudomonadota bacterium]